jgi:hypothetical protein
MIPRVEWAPYVKDFRIDLRFTDGAEGDVDLRDELYGETFRADVAPEFLYEKLRLSV